MSTVFKMFWSRHWTASVLSYGWEHLLKLKHTTKTTCPHSQAHDWRQTETHKNKPKLLKRAQQVKIKAIRLRYTFGLVGQNNLANPQHSTPLHLLHQDLLSWEAVAVGWPLAALWEPRQPQDGEKVRTKTHKQTLKFMAVLLPTVQAKGSRLRQKQGEWKPIQNTLGPSSGQKNKTAFKTVGASSYHNAMLMNTRKLMLHLPDHRMLF